MKKNMVVQEEEAYNEISSNLVFHWSFTHFFYASLKNRLNVLHVFFFIFLIRFYYYIKVSVKYSK